MKLWARRLKYVFLWQMLWTITVLGMSQIGFAESAVTVPAGVERYLARQAKVRVYISQAPGMGHQIASLNVMKRLRQLGFTGRFEVIFADDNLNKLLILVPDLLPLCINRVSIRSMQYLSPNRIF